MVQATVNNQEQPRKLAQLQRKRKITRLERTSFVPILQK